jgi:hypothetical protein
MDVCYICIANRIFVSLTELLGRLRIRGNDKVREIQKRVGKGKCLQEDGKEWRKQIILLYVSASGAYKKKYGRIALN